MQSDPDFDGLLPELRAFFAISDLHLVLKKEWGASVPENRRHIRAFIHDNIHACEEIFNLSEIPSLPRGKISISHSKALGGVFWTGSDRDLGFDVELIARCRPEMMKRVSTAQEMTEAPSMAALWTAKEAAFKAIPRGAQPYSVSQIIIGGWEKTTRPDSWRWRISAVPGDTFRDTPGITICQNYHAMSFLVK